MAKTALKAIYVKRDDYPGLRERLSGIKNAKVSFGIFAKEGQQTYKEGGGLTTLQVGEIHEFGKGVPERSFIRAYVDTKQPQIREAATRLMASVAEGKREPEDALELLGQAIVGGIQKRIADRIAPPLDPETIRRKTRAGKQGDVPLIDTGQLRSSITYKVEINRTIAGQAAFKAKQASVKEKRAVGRAMAKKARAARAEARASKRVTNARVREEKRIARDARKAKAEASQAKRDQIRVIKLQVAGARAEIRKMRSEFLAVKYSNIKERNEDRTLKKQLQASRKAAKDARKAYRKATKR